MEDFDQTQLFHTESYLTTRLQSTTEIKDEDEYIMHLLDENGTLTTDDDYFDASFPSPCYHSARNHPTVGIPASFYPNARNGENVLGFPVSLYPDARNGQVTVSLFSDYAGDDEVEKAIMYESISKFIDDYYPVPDYVKLDDVREERSALPIVRSPQTPKDGLFLTMAFGVRETGDIRSGLGLSLLLKANRLFVETIQVEQPSDSKVGPILYGFDSQPLLNVTTSWLEAHYAYLQANMHKASFGSDGYDHRYGLGYCYRHGQCLYDLSSRDTTLSWNIIHASMERVCLAGYDYPVG
nr:hypothetical protein [Tanacetum cinerariifolium]